MMYQRKFAVALKSANGRVLREFDNDKVYVPFGSEYSVFCKNMHNRRAIAQVSIDGQDVGDGMTFVVPAYGQVEIERFVKNGNLGAGNRFKFIERTGAVANHRGVDAEDGLVRVTFQLEQPQPRIIPRMKGGYLGDVYGGGHHPRSRNSGTFGYSAKSFSGDAPVMKGVVPTCDSFNASASASMDNELLGGNERGVAIAASVENEVGVTAAGSISDQQFNMSENFPLEVEKTVFILQILGETADNTFIREPVTVKTRPRCSQCGTFNHVGAKFCSECSAGLQIV